MNILVAIASKHGSTRDIAKAIADELNNAGHEPRLSDVSSVTALDDFEAVIVGSGVYMGRWLPEASAFIRQYHQHLAAMPVWLFSSGPLGPEDSKSQEVPGDIDTFMATLNGRGHEIFAGSLNPRALSLGERLITKLVHAPTGDYRDWDAIRSWARDIATTLDHAATDRASETGIRP